MKKRCIVWIHIDHIDNKDGDVWAVQVKKDFEFETKYITCHRVVCYIPLSSKTRTTQPRAYLSGVANKVRVTKRQGRITVYIY